jgi:multicomponent Na+:H+ antiporter subunit E
MIANRLIIFILGFLIWMLLNWSFSLQYVIIGLAVSGLVNFLMGDLFSKDVRYFGRVSRYFWFAYYVPLVIWECIKGNLDVIARMLKSSPCLRPGIIRIKTGLKSDTALAFLANSITLARGTFCVDVDPDKGILYVHWNDVSTEDAQEAAELISAKFENILKKVFD